MKQTRRPRVIAPTVTPGIERTSIVIAIACGVGALLVRLAYLSAIQRAPFFTVLMGDSKGYDLWARQIAAGDWIGHGVFYQAPLYPYFMGLVYAVAGHDVYVLRVVQAVLGSISCALLAHTASRLFSTRAAIIAGAALACYPAAIFFDGLLQKTALDAFLTAFSLWLISGILVGRARLFTWLMLGAAMGALGLTRENALILIVVILAWCLFGNVRPQSTATTQASGRLRNAAAFILGVALLLVPVAVRNYAVGGGFYLTTSQFGPNLYLGNNARTDGTAGSLIGGRGSSEYERQDAIDIAEGAAGGALTPGEVSSFWTDRTLAFIGSQPFAWMRLMGRKTLLLWNSAEAFDTESQESYAEWWPPLGWLSTIGHFGVLVPLACIGLVVTWADRRRLAVLYVIVAAYSASVILFFIYARYRFPLVPFLLLFAAAGLADGLKVLRARSRSQQLAVTALVVAVVVVTNWPLLSASEMRAITEHNLGAALQSEGQIDAAIDRYHRAIAVKADYVPAYSNLGTALLARGRPAEAIAAYKRALAIDPAFPDAHFNLGNALMQEGRAHEAVEEFQRALEGSSVSADVHTNLGLALLADGRGGAGIAQLEAAVTLAPRAANAQRALGEALSDTPRRPEALAHLRAAVTAAPEDGAAHYALGRFLLEERRAPEAVDELRLAAARPDSPVETHNDLGIALATLGRLDEAIAEFQRAIEQQPGNSEAQRNLDIAVANRQRQAMAPASPK